MIQRLALVVLLSLLVRFSLADELKDDPDHLSYKITKVVKATITVASERDDYDPKEDCSTFVMTPKLATFFFSHSHPVTNHDRMHLYNFSSCSAEGKVKFANGDEADWTIQRGGIGLMQMLNGKLKNELIILHCAKCEDWGL